MEPMKATSVNSRAEKQKFSGKQKALDLYIKGQELFYILFCRGKEGTIVEKTARIGQIRW